MPTPTTEQLCLGVGVLNKLIAQIPCFHVFEEYVAPLFPNNHIGHSLRAITHNAALDSTLISLRCFNEFFKPNAWKDDIRAYHFPGLSMSQFLDDDHVTSIDKYLAHVTITRLDIVTKHWLIDDLVVLGLTRAIEFLSFIDSSFPVPDQATRKEVCDVYEVITRELHKIIKPQSNQRA